jgi:hypothetical protein
VHRQALATAVARDAEVVERAAGPASRAPVRVEPIAPDVAVVRPTPPYSSGSPEQLDAALKAWTPPRVERTAPAAVARTIPKAPTAAEPEQSTRARHCVQRTDRATAISARTPGGRRRSTRGAITGRMAPMSAAITAAVRDGRAVPAELGPVDRGYEPVWSGG